MGVHAPSRYCLLPICKFAVQPAMLCLQVRMPSLGSMSHSEQKCCLLALLRFELRWLAKRSVKEMEVLIKTDTEPSDKVRASGPGGGQGTGPPCMGAPFASLA